MGSYFYSDKIVLAMSGAKLADRKTYFDFYTVTQNMAIAAGVPMPRVFVIEDDAMTVSYTHLHKVPMNLCPQQPSLPAQG